jgi:ABC-type multidrug transport system ATPase subunit
MCLQFLAQIGYCPQFDAINEALTGREMLKLFASLRGVSKINIDSEVNKWITLMGELRVFLFFLTL